MQLTDLIKPLDQLTDEELLARLNEVRHRRTVERPAAARRVAQVEKKETRVKVNAMDKLIADLSTEEREALLKQLGG